MTSTRALRRITALLCFAMLTAGALPASARRRPGPTATPVQSPDMVLQDQLFRAGTAAANDLRLCDRFLSRASAPLAQTRYVARTLNGRLEVNAGQNPGGAQYTSCLEVVMGNAVLQAAQSAGQTIPYNTNPVAVDVAMPAVAGGAVPPQNPTPVYVPVQPQPVPVQPQPVPVQPVGQVQYSPVFQEPGRFTVRNVRLAGQGPSITISNGGVIEGTMEIQHNCPGCGGAINQVIVGIGNEAQAQACVWNGGANSRGFETVRFQLVIPNQPGTYEVRVRYAQAYSCQQGALGWWRVDRPNGPDARSNIGVVVVQAQNPPPVVVQPQPTQPVNGNLIVDGSFEQQALAYGTWQVLTSLPGWRLASGPGIELQNNVAGRAAEGAQFVELDSHASSAIYQDVQTIPGQTYELRLAYSARPGTPRIDNSVAVVLNGQVVSSLEAEGSHLTDTQWNYQTIRFQATSNSTRVELRHVGRSNGLGGYVDDVSVVAVDGGRGRGRGRGRWR